MEKEKEVKDPWWLTLFGGALMIWALITPASWAFDYVKDMEIWKSRIECRFK